MQDLTGSDKQIAWATSIRDAVIAILTDTKYTRLSDHRRAMYLNVAERITDSGWWIERRDMIRRPYNNMRNIGAHLQSAMADEEIDLLIAGPAPAPVAAEPTAAVEAPTPNTAQAAIAVLRTIGRTIREIAAKLGVHRSTVYRWAAGQRNPNARNLAALLAA